MLRVYYLFPVLVFMLVIGALYWENTTEKGMKRKQKEETKTEQSALSIPKSNYN